MSAFCFYDACDAFAATREKKKGLRVDYICAARRSIQNISLILSDESESDRREIQNEDNDHSITILTHLMQTLHFDCR